MVIPIIKLTMVYGSFKIYSFSQRNQLHHCIKRYRGFLYGWNVPNIEVLLARVCDQQGSRGMLLVVNILSKYKLPSSYGLGNLKNNLFNKLLTSVLVEQPRLHRVG